VADSVIRILTLMRLLVAAIGSVWCVCSVVWSVAMSFVAFYALFALYGQNIVNLALAINKLVSLRYKIVVKNQRK